MKNLLLIIPLVLLLCFTFSCQKGEEVAEESMVDVDADKTAIEGVREKELIAFNSGDVQGFINIVTDDVVFDAPNRLAAVGKEAVRALCEAAFERYDYDATYSVEEIVIEKDWAFDRGVWLEKMIPKDGGEQKERPCGMLQIYKRQNDGSWKLARSIWNFKYPSPPQQED